MISYSIIKNRTQSIIIFDFNAEMYSSLVKIQKNQSFKVHHKSMKLILGVFEGTENNKKGVKTLLWSWSVPYICPKECHVSVVLEYYIKY